MCVECENAHAERIFFSLACGESVLQSALIFSEEVRCCKWKLSIGFIYPLFFFPSHLLLSLPLFFFSVQSVPPPSYFSAFCCLCPSLPSSISLPPFVPFFHFFLSFLCLISILSLSHSHPLSPPSHSLSLPPCVDLFLPLSPVSCVFLSSAAGAR